VTGFRTGATGWAATVVIAHQGEGFIVAVGGEVFLIIVGDIVGSGAAVDNDWGGELFVPP